MGGIETLTSGLKFLDGNEIEVEFNDSQLDAEDLEIPAGPIAFENLCDCISAILTILLGYWFLKTANEPTRANTWTLWKKTAMIITIQFILLFISFIAIFIGFGMAFDEW